MQLLNGLLPGFPAQSISDALNGPTKQLSSLKHEFDETFALDIINIFITQLVTSFNIGKTMNSMQIEDTCLLIYEDFWHLKMADFQLFVKEAKKGKFGKLYDRIDGQIIFEWLTMYDRERMEIAARQKPKEVELTTPLLPKIELPSGPVEVKMYEKVREPVAKAPPPKNDNPIYQMHQRWYKQFDHLYDKQRRSDKTFRFVFVHRLGKIVDMNGYLDYKQHQYLRVFDYFEMRHERDKVLQVDRVPPDN